MVIDYRTSTLCPVLFFITDEKPSSLRGYLVCSMKRNVWEKDVKCWICIAIYKSNQVWTKAGADDDVAHVGINLANYDRCLFGSYGEKKKI